ncbi:aminoglycoside phosphotransferase family protein [Actinospica durhamensis]|uniref:Aminoglycoside phosphotransferase family protein n=1 Tax=Actinospica durhamensis TaxID=1508375 RepID=A0A941IRN5_9ACTN|nr:aminoglycoside phosphotransferase family protein [Actinospica durhamensis]MBR7835497.1 aminoglycoside phosphotransferase family protein [Actinospica durhamensis]
MPALSDRGLAARLLADLLPDHGPVGSARPLEGGSVSGVCGVSFTDPAVPDVVLKLAPAADAWMARKEAYAYRLLETHGIGPIPRVLAEADDVELLDGASCVVLSILPGRPLGEIAPDLTPVQRRQVYRQLGALLARIHAVPMDGFGYIIAGILDPAPDNASYMARAFARGLREYREAGADDRIADAIGRTVAEHGAVFADCPAPVLCHGDFHEHNILVEQGRDGEWNVSGLIDPANLHAGDPLVDLVRTDAFCMQGDEAKLAGLLEGYGPGGDRWPAAWAPRMRLYGILLALELRNWFAEREPQHVPALDEQLRDLAENPPSTVRR